MARQKAELVASATLSLFQPRREYEKPEIAAASRRNLEKIATPPYSTEMSMLEEFVDVCSRRCVVLSPFPYWNNDRKYDPLEVYATAVQFFDCHNAPLPKTTLPPSEDVNLFIRTILSSDGKLSVSEQFKILLKITNGNILGAGNLGLIGTRILARGWDSRAYPDIIITPKTIEAASERLAPFEDGKESLGDNYYFWTNFFATATFTQLGDKISNMLDQLFIIGTPIMRFVRHRVVRQPTVSSGCIPSDLGRLMGKVISKHLNEIKD